MGGRITRRTLMELGAAGAAGLPTRGWAVAAKGIPPAKLGARQARVIERGWRAVRDFSARAEREGRVGVVRTFAQHVVHDQGTESNTFKSGLRDDFRFDPPAVGARRPAWFVWRELR